MKRRLVTVEGFMLSSATVNEKPRGAPPPAPPGDFCLGKSHQNRSAPKGSPADAGPSRLRRPQEVRIRRVPAPDAHAPNPFGAPLGSTSAYPRRSLAYGAGKPTELSPGRCWAPYGAPAHRQALGERPERVARRRCATGPRDRDGALGRRREPNVAEARGKSRHPGVLSLGDFSLHEQREVTRVRGGSPRVAVNAAEGGSINLPCAA